MTATAGAPRSSRRLRVRLDALPSMAPSSLRNASGRRRMGSRIRPAWIVRARATAVDSARPPRGRSARFGRLTRESRCLNRPSGGYALAARDVGEVDRHEEHARAGGGADRRRPRRVPGGAGVGVGVLVHHRLLAGIRRRQRAVGRPLHGRNPVRVLAVAGRVRRVVRRGQLDEHGNARLRRPRRCVQCRGRVGRRVQRTDLRGPGGAAHLRVPKHRWNADLAAADHRRGLKPRGLGPTVDRGGSDLDRRVVGPGQHDGVPRVPHVLAGRHGVRDQVHRRRSHVRPAHERDQRPQCAVGLVVHPNNHYVYVLWLSGNDVTANTASGCNYSQLGPFDKAWVSVSTDGGTTWTAYQAWHGKYDPTTLQGDNADKIFGTISVDQAGQVHVMLPVRHHDDPVGYTTGCQTNSECQEAPRPTRLLLVTSPDQGQHWTKLAVLTPGTKGSNFFPWIAAGGQGVVDVIWFKTASSKPNDPSDVWNAQFGQVTGATAIFGPSQVRYAATPVLTQLRLDPNPVHVGGICTFGIFCSVVPNANRNLADSISIALDPSGGANAVWTNDAVDPEQIEFACQSGGPSATTGADLTGCFSAP